MMNILFLLIALCIPIELRATVVARGGGGTGSETFTVDISTKAFDPATGTLYVGLAEAGTGNLAISAVSRVTNNGIPTFVGIAKNAVATDLAIQNLTISSAPGVATQRLIGVTTEANTKLFALGFGSGESVLGVLSSTLLDASGAAGANGAATDGILTIASQEMFSFAAVKANGSGFFGAPDSGIAVVRITQTDTGFDLNQTAAVSGDSGIKAQKLDGTIAAVKITTDATLSNFATLNWDDYLERLYIGLQLQSGATAGDGIRSVVVARVHDDGTLDFSAIAPDAAITPQASGAQTQIVAGIQDDNVAIELAVIKTQVMHTSTGPSYLIVNGGNGASNETGNTLFALPLVDDPTSAATHGTLANKNSALVDFKFVTPATAAGQLATTADAFAVVGGAALPIEASNSISDMVVLGDTVYVSSYLPQNSLNETGILYTQALFDSTGKITGWTAWSKRAFPITGIPTLMSPGRVQFFNVDASTGKVIAIGGDTPNTVALTRWDYGSSETALATQLNSLMTQGCYCALDLDQSTAGLATSTTSRYALFGGSRQVVFARTSVAFAATTTSVQTVTSDFSSAQNSMQSYLPVDAGSVTSLEFSRNSTANFGYFFAGTENGLYVFSNNGTGFTTSTFGALNATPLSTGNWQKVSTIAGSVVDIKSSGLALYVLTFQTSSGTPFASTLYRIAYNGTVSTMFASPVPIASSASGTLSNAALFTGIQILNTGVSEEQLLLATNNGLFNSTRAGGVQGATSQTNAAWTPLASGTYYGIAGIDSTSTPHTAWPFTIQDPTRNGIFDQATIAQVSGSSGTSFARVPVNFNAAGNTAPFSTVNPITSFWSDGARRFFIVNQGLANPNFNQIMSFPFYIQPWAIDTPAAQIIGDPTFANQPPFYWARQIGITGALLAGTNNGVVALE